MNKNFGLTDFQLTVVKELVTQMLAHAVTYNVFVFGSRVHGTEKKYSDLDLWIDSEPQLSQQQLADFLEKVENSDLPLLNRSGLVRLIRVMAVRFGETGQPRIL